MREDNKTELLKEVLMEKITSSSSELSEYARAHPSELRKHPPLVALMLYMRGKLDEIRSSEERGEHDDNHWDDYRIQLHLLTCGQCSDDIKNMGAGVLSAISKSYTGFSGGTHRGRLWVTAHSKRHNYPCMPSPGILENFPRLSSFGKQQPIYQLSGNKGRKKHHSSLYKRKADSEEHKP